MAEHPPEHAEAGGAVDAAIAAMRARGERVTGARRAVLEALAGRPHQDADAVAARVALAQPGVHRATIYRTLAALVELGVVAHTHVPDGATIYHLAVSGHGHAHLQCVSCGRMFDMPIGWLADLAGRVESELGFTLDAGHAALLGTCRDCRGCGTVEP